jgi:hypothetical protein
MYCVAWRAGSKCVFTTLRTWVRTCTWCCERADARVSKVSCAHLRASWPGESWGQKGAGSAEGFSTVWRGRELSAGVGTTGACGTTFFEIRSRVIVDRAFDKLSSVARLEPSMRSEKVRRDRHLSLSFASTAALLEEFPMIREAMRAKDRAVLTSGQDRSARRRAHQALTRVSLSGVPRNQTGRFALPLTSPFPWGALPPRACGEASARRLW